MSQGFDVGKQGQGRMCTASGVRYRTAIYCRLSDEDYQKKREVSESIENQLSICRKHIAENCGLEEAGVYIDDGYTGLDYERDGYVQMMEDVEEGRIDCIITKSLARLGREHAETIKLFKQTFVMKRIRYIAVLDHIDFNGRITSIDIPIKVVMNDNYSMETSNNIRSAFGVKAARGEFIGSFAPYGYRKDERDKNKLVVDPAAAEIVRRIYAEFIAGYDITAIAHGLNDDGIPCPSEYKRQNGYHYRNNKRLEKTNYWTYSTIKKMLLNENESYIGNMVQHRTEKMAYNIKKLTAVPRDEWIRMEDTHEPIIEKEDYEMVQKFIGQRRRHMDCGNNVTCFAGLLFCGDCGRCLSRTTRKSGKVFRCSTYAKIGADYCTQHLIYENQVEHLVLQAIQETVSDALKCMDLRRFGKRREESENTDEITRLKAGFSRLEAAYRRMVVNLSMELISPEDFTIYRAEYERRKAQMEARRKQIEERRIRGEGCDSEYFKWLEYFLQHREITEASRELLVNLIERIDVYEDKRITITFRFREPCHY